MKKLVFKNKLFPIIDGNYAVIGNQIITTDLEQTIILPNDNKKDNGVYNILNQKVYDLDNYPESPKLSSNSECISMKKTLFLEYWSSLMKSANNEELRPTMNSIYFDLPAKKMVSTDAHVLKTVDINIGGNGKHIVPRTLNITKFKEVFKQDDVIRIDFDDKYAKFSGNTSDNEYIIKKVEGVYPNYAMIMPSGEQHTTKLTFAPETLKKMEQDMKDVKKITTLSCYLIKVIEIEGKHKAIFHYKDEYSDEQVDIHFEYNIEVAVDVKYKKQRHVGLLMPMITNVSSNEMFGFDLIKLLQTDATEFYIYDQTHAMLFHNEYSTNLKTKQVMKKETVKQTSKVVNDKVQTSKKHDVKMETKQLKIEVVSYSEKAFAVFGDTRQLKEILKDFGLKYNKYLTKDNEKKAGWIGSRKKQSEFVEMLSGVNNLEVVQ